MSEGTATLEQPTEVGASTETSNVVDVSAQVQANNANGQNGNGQNDNGQSANGSKPVNRWAESKHIFATEHPAHNLLSNQTAYGRDLKDEHGNWIDKKPDGFDRVILPNLIPADRLAEAERLCRMHNVDIRDEWRYAQLQMTEAVIKELSGLPVPADYKEQGKRLSSEEREAKKAVTEARKAEMDALKAEGKRIREEMAAKRKAMQEEYAMKVAEIKGIPYVAPVEGQPQSVVTLGETFVPPVAPPTPRPHVPVTEVQPTEMQTNEQPTTNGTQEQPAAQAESVKPESVTPETTPAPAGKAKK